MKAVTYEPKSGTVQVDEKVPIRNFAEYIAALYREATNDPNVTYGDVSLLIRHGINIDQEADFGIGKSVFGPDLIAMGSKIPTDIHKVRKYFASDENFEKFTQKLEEICGY